MKFPVSARVAALVFLGCHPAAFASGLAHPRIEWAFQTDGPVRGAAVVAGDAILFGSADGFVYAVDKTNGRLRWRFPTGGAIAGAPAVAGATVVVAGRGDSVHALDLADGAPRWEFRMQPALPTPTSWSYFTAPPVVDGDQVLVPSGDGNLYALDLATGERRWAFKTGDSLRAAPLVADGTIYQPSGDDFVYALAAKDGALQWKFATAGVGYDLSQGFIRSDIFSRPSLQDGRLVFASRDANVYAVDIATHEKKWSFAYDTTWAMSSIVDDGTVYVGWSTNNKINALDLATGGKRWEFTAGSHTYTTALIVGDDSYWGCADGKIYDLDKRTGALRWAYDVGSDIYSSLIHDGDTFYCGTDDGRLLAIHEGAAAVYKAVYLPADVPANLTGFVIDPALATYLVERGYERLASAEALSRWLAARAADGAPSVVVFDYAQIPAAVAGAEPAHGPLRGYLESGGKVVWLWGMPNQVTFDATGKFLAYDPTVAARLLEVDYLGFEDGGNYFARATQAGRNWGLPAHGKTSFASLQPGMEARVTVLATDEYGRVGAFVRKFHPRPGSGWVNFNPTGYGVPMRPAELAQVARVAGYGLD
ncbi:MAG TPA: PQQ-binding-like beta-propeller repeat protein [Opitutus sp.]|nr:PQQ-binding-like beta-propeller repeat protein [Opitutus sp.]